MTTPSGDIVPRSNGFGGIGTTIKKWLNGYFYNIFATGGTISGVAVTVGSGITLDITDANLIGPVTTSAGISDAGKIPALGADGTLDPSIIGTVSGAGLSAYDVAIENGFVGTEQEWLDSLSGVPREGGIGLSFESAQKPKNLGNYSCFITYDMTIPENCTGSLFYNVVNPSTTVEVLIQINDVTEVTLSVDSSGNATWVCDETIVTSGSKISFVFPVQDSLWSGVMIFLKGLRS